MAVGKTPEGQKGERKVQGRAQSSSGWISECTRKAADGENLRNEVLVAVRKKEDLPSSCLHTKK